MNGAQPTTAWMVENCGTLVLPTAASMRDASIALWLKGRPRSEWDRMRKKGWVSCIKVRIEPVPRESTGQK